MTDHALLGLPSTATIDQIRSRWKQLARDLHPDRPGGDAARFAALKEAADRLIERARGARRPSRSWQPEDFSQTRTPPATQDSAGGGADVCRGNPCASDAAQGTGRDPDRAAASSSAGSDDREREAPHAIRAPTLGDIDAALSRAVTIFSDSADTAVPGTAVGPCHALPGERTIDAVERAVMTMTLRGYRKAVGHQTMTADRGGLYPDPRAPLPEDVQIRLPAPIPADRVLSGPGGWEVHLAMTRLPDVACLALPRGAGSAAAPLFLVRPSGQEVLAHPVNGPARALAASHGPVRVILGSPLARAAA